MKIEVAPVQGHTDAAWRHFHHEIYGRNSHAVSGIENGKTDESLVYYTPFIRLERGDFRKHDLKDWLSHLNEGTRTVPQVIFRDMEELEPLVKGLVERGATRIDLNTGCPFPLQTARGRGAAFVGNVNQYSRIPALVEAFPDVSFSVKMRLGFENPAEWRGVIEILNSMKLDHVALHPRVAKQQYGGELHLDQFEEFLSESRNPVIFNGEIKLPEDAIGVMEQFPKAEGVMIARGILGRPSLAAEIQEGEEWSREKRLEKMMTFHDRLIDHYRAELCGDHQILSKIKPFWEYAEEEIGRKAWKAIAKAQNMAKYTTAVAMIGQ